MSSRTDTPSLDAPVAVIGAGPVGLAAAAHLHRARLPFTVFESGPDAGAAVRGWSHVRMFSPWSYAIDDAPATLLERMGWQRPPDSGFPTGEDLVDRYLEPLAATPEIASRLRTGTRVVAVSRRGADALRSLDRSDRPFLLRLLTPEGDEEDFAARAVIDASGTWGSPNPLGGSGLPARGEAAALAAGALAYGMPPILGGERDAYAGRRVAVVGTGHSALQALADLVQLAQHSPGTHVTWVLRRDKTDRVFQGLEKEALPERARLAEIAREMTASGAIRVEAGFASEAVEGRADGWWLRAADRSAGPFDRIVSATGFRPDLALTRELRLAIDPTTEAPERLASLIDPNVHTCGSVPPHGEAELRHADEPGFYTVGMKSYGRAPTFLLRTGYEQVRSVVCALSGDADGARRVELVLPAQGGACSVPEPLVSLGRAGSRVLDQVRATAGCC